MDTFLTNNFNRLRNFTNSLSKAVENDLPEIEQTLDGNKPLPQGCPSRESMALMVLGHIEEKLEEVAAAVADIKSTLSARHHAKKKKS